MKAGFCNAICPVLPVERLYGQRPLARIDNPRCAPCTMCTIKGCIDLATAKSIAQTLGRARRSHTWLSAWYGVFVAAFPGFVVGYYTTQDGPLATAGTVYLTIAAWAGGSYILTQLVVRAFRIRSALAIPALAAVAFALYYWFAAALIAPALRLTDAGTVGIRAAALALIVAWFWRAQAEPNDNTTPQPHLG